MEANVPSVTPVVSCFAASQGIPPFARRPPTPLPPTRPAPVARQRNYSTINPLRRRGKTPRWEGKWWAKSIKIMGITWPGWKSMRKPLTTLMLGTLISAEKSEMQSEMQSEMNKANGAPWRKQCSLCSDRRQPPCHRKSWLCTQPTGGMYHDVCDVHNNNGDVTDVANKDNGTLG